LKFQGNFIKNVWIHLRIKMIERIKNDDRLKKYLVDSCCDEGICLEFDESIDKNDVVIIKVDAFYNGQKLGKATPRSPDCLIIIKCKNGGYSLHIAELKNITTSSRYDIREVLDKFNTCFDDFLPVQFRDLLFVDYKKIKMYFISKIDSKTKDMGLKYDLLTAHKVKYNGKTIMIEAFMPLKKIKACY
jgi:hypothetical protein